MFIDTRIQEEVLAALRRDPRIKHQELKGPPPLAHRRPDEIRAAALQRLTADARIRSTHIRVNVSRGRLTLTGYVRHDAEGAAALEDVTSRSGVVGVTNHIKVRSRQERVQ